MGRLAPWLAAAAVLLAFGVAGLALWLWSWPEGREWPTLEGPTATLGVGETVTIDPGESLVVRVARIGWMRVEGEARVRLLSTASNRHRVALDEGTLHAGVWAPPGSFGVRTPAGSVLDLGCELVLRVQGQTATVEVTSGWVQLENRWGQSIVPAGARATMVPHRIPSVPVFRDAPTGLGSAVAALEREVDADALQRLLGAARDRDVYSLLVLATRQPEARDALLRRAAALSSPPPGLLERALGGDRLAVWDWIDELPLPPPKRWVPNWRDRWRDGG
jgi:hypothetical protein